MNLENSQGKGLCGSDEQMSVKTSIIKMPKCTKSEQQKEKIKQNIQKSWSIIVTNNYNSDYSNDIFMKHTHIASQQLILIWLSPVMLFERQFAFKVRKGSIID